ncbi:TonB-dependent receptor [Fusobacterium russii]|uniref:TonB-dependent receptor n=1 Tax=Fusobacterium russii TaxID=854 RepID=UPI00039CE1EF|nr:TonB-dependent receptor [Fusobacterium russii]
MKKKLMILAILSISVSAFAMKEEVPVQRLNETVITTPERFGTKVRNVSKNIQIITKKDMKEKGAKTLFEALRGVPGVVIRRDGGGHIDLRGSGDKDKSNMIFLIDGIPYTGLSIFDINSISMEEIERIEIIQSGGAVLYGDGAIGGIVNLVTKPITDEKYSNSIGLEYGSWEMAKLNVNVGTKLTDNLAVSASYSGEQTEEYKNRSIDFKDKKDRRESIWLKTKYNLNDGEIVLKYNHLKNIDYITGLISAKDFKENPKKAGTTNASFKAESDLWNLSFNKKLNSKFEVFLQGGYYTDETKYYEIAPEYTDFSKKGTKSHFIRPQIKYNYMEDSYIILGGDTKKETVTNKLSPNSPKTIRKKESIYLLNSNKIGNFEITEGYRIEKVDLKRKNIAKDFKEEGIELGINYLYSDTGNLYFNYTKGFRVPTLGEMSSWVGDMKSHKNHTFELGLRDVYENTSINTSIFTLYSKDEIFYDSLVANPSPKNPNRKGANRNFEGKVRRIGAQLALEHNIGKLSLREKISYMDPKIMEGYYKGKVFPGVPKLTAALGLTYNFENGLKLNVDGYYQGKIYAGTDFLNKYGKHNSYTVVDANISYAFENGLELYGGVKNLFDKTYATAFFPRATGELRYDSDNGRSFYTGFKYTF